MTDTIHARTMLIEENTFLAGPMRLESEPWTSFYMAGESIRELRRAPKNKASTGARVRQRPEDHRRDEEPSSRMENEGCLNESTATLPHAAGWFGIGGRLHLVGSPIF